MEKAKDTELGEASPQGVWGNRRSVLQRMKGKTSMAAVGAGMFLECLSSLC